MRRVFLNDKIDDLPLPYPLQRRKTRRLKRGQTYYDGIREGEVRHSLQLPVSQHIWGGYMCVDYFHEHEMCAVVLCTNIQV